MAEGFARSTAPSWIKVFSAGTIAAGVHPLSVKVMEEAGVDISRQTSKTLGEIPKSEVDVVVTLCDDAAGRCPAFPGEFRRLHLPVEDPISAVGTGEERLEAFRKAREQIRPLVKRLIDELVAEAEANREDGR